MATRTFRVIVRGAFDQLTDAQRAELALGAAEHEPLRAAFTPEGTLTYEIAARPFFSFRFQLTADGDTDMDEVSGQAEARARAWLDERDYGYKNLTSRVDEVPPAPAGARARREQRRSQRA